MRPSQAVPFRGDDRNLAPRGEPEGEEGSGGAAARGQATLGEPHRRPGVEELWRTREFESKNRSAG
jgi:hypothetical protein